MADNTSQDDLNESEEQQPDVPPVDTHGVPPSARPPVEPVSPTEPTVPADPEYQQWAEDTKDLPTAFKRYSDSSREATRLRESQGEVEAERDKAIQQYQSVEEDFEKLRQTNPELHGQVKEAVNALQGDVSNAQTPQVPQQPAIPQQPPAQQPVTEEQVTSLANLQIELGSFRKDYSEFIGDDTEFDRIRSYASSLSGKVDRDGTPFTLRRALVAALQYYKPDMLTDKAKMEAIAEMEQRNSASEPANVPSGGPAGPSTKPLSKAENEALAFFPDMTAEEYSKYKTE